jgi:enoyl-CoA hydratase/carnithine racemase
MGACAILPRIIGHGRAAELLFTGRNLAAEEGLAWGFWNRLSNDVQGDAQALARELASGPTLAHGVTKRQLDAEWHVSIETALDMEAEAQAALMQTNDFKRAYQAFSAKHQPVFRGD